MPGVICLLPSAALAETMTAMRDSLLRRSILQPVWIAICLGLIVGGTVVGIHFALGLGRLMLNPLHHWQPRSDWGKCLIWAMLATIVAIAPTAWSLRRSRRRLARQREKERLQEQPRPQLVPTPSKEPAWKP